MKKFDREKAKLTDRLFCEEGHIMRPVEVESEKNRVFYCADCDEYYLPKSPEDFRIKESGKEREIAFVEGVSAPPDATKISYHCEECGNNEAYRWTYQVGAADEPPHEFNKCTKCGHVEKSGWQI